MRTWEKAVAIVPRDPCEGDAEPALGPGCCIAQQLQHVVAGHQASLQGGPHL